MTHLPGKIFWPTFLNIQDYAHTRTWYELSRLVTHINLFFTDSEQLRHLFHDLICQYFLPKKNKVSIRVSSHLRFDGESVLAELIVLQRSVKNVQVCQRGVWHRRTFHRSLSEDAGCWLWTRSSTCCWFHIVGDGAVGRWPYCLQEMNALNRLGYGT